MNDPHKSRSRNDNHWILPYLDLLRHQDLPRKLPLERPVYRRHTGDFLTTEHRKLYRILSRYILILGFRRDR